jgi:Domain of unknown function (DUF1836).
LKHMQAQMDEWSQTLIDFHLPRWDELPDLDLYMDQVIQLIDRYLSPVIQTEKHPLLTASMVNNYVKKALIPAPEKKRYNRQHVAFLIAITLLKQVLTIPEIKTGILFQGRVNGIRAAYNLFCEEQEKAIVYLCRLAQGDAQSFSQVTIDVENIAVKAATASFAHKLFAEKSIELENNYLKEEEHD